MKINAPARALAPAIALAAAAHPATAQATYTAQTREIIAGELHTIAPDFGFFNANSSWTEPTGGDPDPASASASQFSVPLPDGITISTAAGAFGGEASPAAGRSTCDITFQLDAHAELLISGTVTANYASVHAEPDSLGRGTVTIYRNESEELRTWTTTGEIVAFENNVLELTPGTYRVLVESTANAAPDQGLAGGGATANITLTGTPNPCPADITGDGVLDLSDLTAFIDAFQNTQPAGDFDGNGIHDLTDITAFVTAFQDGCP